MDCRRAKAEIALWVRQDCDRVAELHLEQHLTRCPNCREYRQRIQHTLETVQDVMTEPGGDPVHSLWPRVAARLDAYEESLRRSRFNGWVPALAMAAASVMIFVLATDQSQRRDDGWPVPHLSASQRIGVNFEGDVQPVDATMGQFDPQEMESRRELWRQQYQEYLEQLDHLRDLRRERSRPRVDRPSGW